MNVLRMVVVGGALSYKGLFRWLVPAVMVPSLVLTPALQLALFTLLGALLGSHPAGYYALGNAVHAAGRVSVFGGSVVIARDRPNGTLGIVLGAPAPSIVVFGGRLLPSIATAFLTTCSMLVLAIATTGIGVELAAVPALLGVVLLVSASCSAFGLTIGATALYLRDVSFLPNVANYTMLLLCGINFDPGLLPVGLRHISEVLPLTHGLRVARQIVQGAPVSGWDVVLEGVIAVAYLGVAAVFLKVFESRGRHRGTLDMA